MSSNLAPPSHQFGSNVASVRLGGLRDAVDPLLTRVPPSTQDVGRLVEKFARVGAKVGAETYLPTRRPVILVGDPSDTVVDLLNTTEIVTTRVSRIADIPASGASAIIIDGASVLSASRDEKAALNDIASARPGTPVIVTLGRRTAGESLTAEVAGSGISLLDLSLGADLAALQRLVSRRPLPTPRVLAIGAHCDDIEIGCGGALLLHALRGDDIHILTLSRGAVGGDPATRFEESRAAQRHLGAGLTICGFPDTRISDGATTIDVIERVTAAFNPTVVYVHGVHDTHQDHRAVHAAARSAVRGVPTMLGYRSPSTTQEFLPTHFVGLDRVIEDKVALLAMHASQAHREYMQPEHIKAIARFMGAQAPGVTFAEPYETIRNRSLD